MDLADLTLDRRVLTLLARNDLISADDVLSLNEREILDLPGIGPSSLRALVTALEAAGLALAVDPYGPYECAREGELRRDAGLAGFFLCGTCAQDWREEAFDGQRYEYRSEELKGYCLNCNQHRDDVRLHQWFMCGVCERVARSIGRSIVAAASVMKAWEDSVSPRLPELTLIDADVPRLHRRNAETVGAKVASIDFIAENRKGDAVLGLELKTGKGFVGRTGVGSRIAEFQLDVSDCDDILTVVSERHIPVYLVHAQVIDRAEPPTVRYAALGRWWTDLFSMVENLDRVQQRPRETRQAAYYDTTMFRPFSELAEHLASGEFTAMQDQFARNNWTAPLYG